MPTPFASCKFHAKKRAVSRMLFLKKKSRWWLNCIQDGPLYYLNSYFKNKIIFGQCFSLSAALEEQSFKRNLLRSGGTHCETVIWKEGASFKSCRYLYVPWFEKTSTNTEIELQEVRKDSNQEITGCERGELFFKTIFSALAKHFHLLLIWKHVNMEHTLRETITPARYLSFIYIHLFYILNLVCF